MPRQTGKLFGGMIKASTQRRYRARWRQWCAWCLENGADPHSVVRLGRYCESRGYTARTSDEIRKAICHAHDAGFAVEMPEALSDVTLRGYRKSWRRWCGWCADNGVDPHAADALPGYLADGRSRHRAGILHGQREKWSGAVPRKPLTESTLRQHRQRWRQWCGWCAEQGHDPRSSEALIAEYVAHRDGSAAMGSQTRQAIHYATRAELPIEMPLRRFRPPAAAAVPLSGDATSHAKRLEAAGVDADVRAFLRGGGEVKRIPIGVSGGVIKRGKHITLGPRSRELQALHRGG